MNKITNEIRKFKMHPDLLFSVIKSQAGTVEKAILEGVMNTVDAGATHCKITIDTDGFTIMDDGKGFLSKKEVDLFFETFGTPHKEGDAVYGKFRMGRGQLFSFASTIWKTTTFEMDVDIKNNGLDYLFKENMPYVNGCIIEGKWYSKLSMQDCFLVKKEIEHLVKYMQIPVYLNENKINLDPLEQKWDYKEDDFFIKVNKNSSVLSVYNMGALVTNYPASKFGVAGVVVSKIPLQVNFARNDILVNSCKIWKKIILKTNEILGIETSKKTVLNDAERNVLLNKILSQEIYIGDVFTKGLLVDVSGKKISFKTLLNNKNLSFSANDKKTLKIEEKVNDSKMCLILSYDMLDKFNVTNPDNFISYVNELISINNNHYKPLYHQYQTSYQYKELNEIYGKVIHQEYAPKFIVVSELTKSFNSHYEVLDEKILNKKQKIFLQTLKDINCYISALVFNHQSTNHYGEDYYTKLKHMTRTIHLGKSELNKGWTNGSSYIAINVNMASASPFEIIHLLIHEYCHNQVTMESHDHNIEFYQLFHDILSDGKSVGDIIYRFQKFRNTISLKNNTLPLKTYDLHLEIQEKYNLLEKNDII